ncbi:hypothetical protein ZOSMA_26G00220 [Zostera marina]|uniref:Uncharacterized protein n=1 Tax=Zostera marina TaxID=29655 RepID=A0A0K9PE90_ZOSMR|nr:hypothetical protein ZOSMA_26G00220 [Zostera marina]
MARKRISAAVGEETLESDAALELTLLGIDAVVPSAAISTLSWWKSTKYYAVAWIDPNTKQSVGPINSDTKKNKSITKSKIKCMRKLYFPIYPGTLGTTDSSSIITVQIVSHNRLPFQKGRLIGTAFLPLSSVKMSAETFALPVKWGSGVVHGSLSVSVRVLWDLGCCSDRVTMDNSDTTDISEFDAECESEVFGSSESDYYVVPTAPPVTEIIGSSESIWSCDAVPPTASPRSDIIDGSESMWGGGVLEPVVPTSSSSSMHAAEHDPVGSISTSAVPGDEGKDRNFLTGLILGVFVATVTVVLCRSWRIKTLAPIRK